VGGGGNVQTFTSAIARVDEGNERIAYIRQTELELNDDVDFSSFYEAGVQLNSVARPNRVLERVNTGVSFIRTVVGYSLNTLAISFSPIKKFSQSIFVSEYGGAYYLHVLRRLII
jgi:hypothetical protein